MTDLADLMASLSQSLRPLPSRSIETTLATFPPYRPDSFRDEAAERGNVPPFIIPFYLAVLRGDLPSIEETEALYFAFYPPRHWPQIHNGIQRGVQARLRRAVPSLYRDLHLWALLHEAGVPTFYSMGRDRGGVDLSVQSPWDHTVYFIHAYIGTERALVERQGKTTGERHIDLPLAFNEARNVNGYLLYTAAHVDRVLSLL